MSQSNFTRAPSGEQFQIARSGHIATITEVGAGLREYSVAGRHVIDGFAMGEMCSGGRGQVLMPWPNRVSGGAYQLDGVRHQLALTEPERGNAIHGLVRWAPWRRTGQSRDSVELEAVLHPQPGYPFTLGLGTTYELRDNGLEVRFRARNLSSGSAPFGAGFHPYLKPRGALVDGSLLTIPAGSYLELDERLIPTGRRLPVAGSQFDFRSARPLGSAVLDICFCDLAASRITLDDVELAWDSDFGFLQCFSGDSLAPARRRRGLAAEPMTCAPDAFNSGDGLIRLRRGETWSSSLRISLLGAG